MTHGSLFSGIGGFDLAAEWMGWENLFHCEWNEFGQKVLNHYWPKAETFTDITKTDFKKYANKIDILTGGFPCQPYSTAGKRLGKEDDRHLWPEMCRAIREIKPRYIVGENVSGLLSWNGGLVFNEIQIDLEAEGYEVQPVLLPAVAVNAPHRRDRIWFVAYSNECSEGSPRASGGIESNRSKDNDEQSERGGKAEQYPGHGDVYGDSSNTNNKRLQRGEINRSVGKSQQNGNKQPTRFIRANWEKFPTQSPIRSGDDGIPNGLDGITFPKWRNESIKAYGNAIVPQLAHQIFKAIWKTEKELIE